MCGKWNDESMVVSVGNGMMNQWQIWVGHDEQGMNLHEWGMYVIAICMRVQIIQLKLKLSLY